MLTISINMFQFPSGIICNLLVLKLVYIIDSDLSSVFNVKLKVNFIFFKNLKI